MDVSVQPVNNNARQKLPKEDKAKELVCLCAAAAAATTTTTAVCVLFDR